MRALVPESFISTPLMANRSTFIALLTVQTHGPKIKSIVAEMTKQKIRPPVARAALRDLETHGWVKIDGDTAHVTFKMEAAE